MRDGERGWFPASCATQITNSATIEYNIQRMHRLRKETDVWSESFHMPLWLNYRLNCCPLIHFLEISMWPFLIVHELWIKKNKQINEKVHPWLLFFSLPFVKIHVWIHKKLFKNVKLTRYQITFFFFFLKTIWCKNIRPI